MNGRPSGCLKGCADARASGSPPSARRCSRRSPRMSTVMIASSLPHRPAITFTYPHMRSAVPCSEPLSPAFKQNGLSPTVKFRAPPYTNGLSVPRQNVIHPDASVSMMSARPSWSQSNRAAEERVSPHTAPPCIKALADFHVPGSSPFKTPIVPGLPSIKSSFRPSPSMSTAWKPCVQ